MDFQEIKNGIVKTIKKAETELPYDVIIALKKSYESKVSVSDKSKHPKKPKKRTKRKKEIVSEKKTDKQKESRKGKKQSKSKGKGKKFPLCCTWSKICADECCRIPKLQGNRHCLMVWI